MDKVSVLEIKGKEYELVDAEARSKFLKYKDFVFTFTFTSGSLGTRGAQQSVNLSTDEDGAWLKRQIVGLYINFIDDSSALLPVTFIADNILYANAYRAAATTTNNRVIVRVTYFDLP